MADQEGQLTTLFENAETAVAPAPKKRTLLPLLTVLFLISYALMTMLIIEQGATIENQRAVLRDLFRDSVELSAIKSQAIQQRGHAFRSPNAPSPYAQAPSTQAPSMQGSNPSSQAGPQQHQQKLEKPSIQRPASDINNVMRAVKTI